MSDLVMMILAGIGLLILFTVLVVSWWTVLNL